MIAILFVVLWSMQLSPLFLALALGRADELLEPTEQAAGLAKPLQMLALLADSGVQGGAQVGLGNSNITISRTVRIVTLFIPSS